MVKNNFISPKSFGDFVFSSIRMACAGVPEILPVLGTYQRLIVQNLNPQHYLLLDTGLLAAVCSQNGIIRHPGSEFESIISSENLKRFILITIVFVFIIYFKLFKIKFVP